jgi:hypothetical protein
MTEYIASITSQESINTCSVVGDWSGMLDIGMMKMTLVLHIQQDSKRKINHSERCTRDNSKMKQDVVTLRPCKITRET